MPSDTNGVRPNGNGPWWIQILYRFGVPAGIAIFLIYFLTQTVARDLATAAEAAQTAARAATVSAEAIQIMRAEHQELRFYLRSICLNTASTAAARASCLTQTWP